MISHCQYGFKAKSFTELAVLYLTQHVANRIESKNFTLGVFIDLSKAFDSLDHNILLNKLFHYGVRGIALEWCRSYLTGSHPYVRVIETDSTPIETTKGVPQGSILGPLFFNIFLNDITNASTDLKYILYADDTTLLHSNNNINVLVSKMNTELDKVANWFLANRLIINVKKTCSILFGPKILTNKITFDLFINNIIINRVPSTKFLGVMISSNLSWLEHITYKSNPHIPSPKLNTPN